MIKAVKNGKTTITSPNWVRLNSKFGNADNLWLRYKNELVWTFTYSTVKLSPSLRKIKYRDISNNNKKGGIKNHNFKLLKLSNTLSFSFEVFNIDHYLWACNLIDNVNYLTEKTPFLKFCFLRTLVLWSV